MTQNQSEEPPLNRLLVAVDGSPSSIHAASLALALARRSEAAVIALVVVEDVGPLPTESEKPPGDRDRVEWLAERRFAPVLEALGERAGSLERRVVEGSPPETICRVAEQESVDLIVMGSRGLTAAGRFLLGSVSDAVLRHAPCSVLVTR